LIFPQIAPEVGQIPGRLEIEIGIIIALSQE